MDRPGRRSWYETIKTGPSPEDNALLQLTRELSLQFQMPYWYRQIVWGRLDPYRSIGWIISKPTSLSNETVAVPGTLPEAELMLPEYMKGKLSLDEWKILITLHMVRLKSYNKGRISKLLGKIALAPRGLFFLLLFYIPAAASGGLSGPVLYFPSPIFLLAALWIRRSLRKSLKRQEFELTEKWPNSSEPSKYHRVSKKYGILIRDECEQTSGIPFWQAGWHTGTRASSKELKS